MIFLAQVIILYLSKICFNILGLGPRLGFPSESYSSESEDDSSLYLGNLYKSNWGTNDGLLGYIAFYSVTGIMLLSLKSLSLI